MSGAAAEHTRTAGRLPEFLIIGAAKAGTTTLYEWMGAQPELWLPAEKEPNFFGRQAVWDRGLDWYMSLFADAPPGTLVGEASTSSTWPDTAEGAAERIARHLPDVKLVFVVRHPIERLRSHYRHDALRYGRTETLAERLRDDDNLYVRASLYMQCLQPHIERFPRESIVVIRFEDLVGGGTPGWRAVLDAFDLPYREPPGMAFNVSAQQRQMRRFTVTLINRLPAREVARALPAPVRAVGRRAFLRRPSSTDRILEASRAPVPRHHVERMAGDAALLAEWLGRDELLWDLEVT